MTDPAKRERAGDWTAGAGTRASAPLPCRGFPCAFTSSARLGSNCLPIRLVKAGSWPREKRGDLVGIFSGLEAALCLAPCDKRLCHLRHRVSLPIVTDWGRCDSNSSTSNSDVKGRGPRNDRGVGRPRAPARSDPRRSPSSQGDARIPVHEFVPRAVVLDNPTAPHALCKDNGGTTPTIARRRAPPLPSPAYDRQWRFAYAKRSRSFEIVSREAMTFPCRPRPTARCPPSGSRRHEGGTGGSQRETAGGKRVRASPPMSRALWSGARRSASLPPRGDEDNVCASPLSDDFAKPKAKANDRRWRRFCLLYLAHGTWICNRVYHRRRLHRGETG